MANPFSAVPTPFVVELRQYSCFGNCIWDSLGIAAMTGRDARIKTACGDCGTAMEVTVANGALQHTEGLVHFAIPARHWWDDIVYN
jgi:Alkylmercury lyase